MMRLTAELDEHAIEVMPLTITITMAVKEWREVMRGEHYTTNSLQCRVADLLGDITNATKRTLVASRDE